MSFSDSIYKLISETSTNLPSDVRRLIFDANVAEEKTSLSKVALSTICQNIDVARDTGRPICQDTGLPYFRVRVPRGTDEREMEECIRIEVAKATADGLLRPNSVDPVSGKNTGDNIGPGTPVVHFSQHDDNRIVVELSLKGGGSENMSTQYSLPCEVSGMGRANRDLEGVRKCILDAVFRAQGKGCSPGYLGVCIGGDRAGGYECAKEQLFRPADDENQDPVLRDLEASIPKEANRLGIGAMGFGGGITLLGCKIGTRNRIPASFFVSIAYQCWAFRRLGVVLDAESGEISSWLHRADSEVKRLVSESGVELSGREILLEAPISEETIRGIEVGDVVVINGPIHTGRDEMHKYLLGNDSPVDLDGQVIYHCGPVMIKDETGKWQVRAAGPTTSIREEPYQADVIGKFGIRAVVGKGGMGPKTLEGLKKHGAVYLTAVGGAAQVYARSLFDVEGVDLLDEFGVPEAMWHYKAKNFTTVCTMDSHGRSLHSDIEEKSRVELTRLMN